MKFIIQEMKKTHFPQILNIISLKTKKTFKNTKYIN
jgi:hypothetical protein